MSGFAPLFGRNGSTAGGDPQVAELLNRTLEGQFKATTTFDGTVAHLRTLAPNPWTAPVPTMAVTHAQWLSSMLWQMATGYLDGVVMSFRAHGSLPPQVYKECDSLCDYAARATMEAIRLQSELDHGSRPPNAVLASLPNMRIDGPGYVGIWGAYQAIYLQVYTDLYTVENLGISKQMRDVHQTVTAALKPKADVFAYLQSSWATTTSVENRQQLIRQALPVVSEIFAIGQQLWAPYLLGQVYVTALRYRPTLEDLELGFDPWCLTDPTQKRNRQGDKASQDELTKFWESVADPASTYQLSEQIMAALLTRRIRRRTGRSYNQIPWPSQYLVRVPVQFGTRSFNVGDLVSLYVSVSNTGKLVAEVRRTGRANSAFDLLGQYRQK